MFSIPVLARYSNLVAMMIPAIIFLGWITGTEGLTILLHSNGLPMNPTSAICFLLLGTALFNARAPSSKKRRKIAFVLSIFPLGISLFHSQPIFGTGVRVDQFLFHDRLNGNVMPWHTAIGFFMASLSILFFQFKGRGALTISPLLALGVGWLSMLAITGYFYGVDILNRTNSYSPMALSTAVAFLFFSVSMMLSKRHYEPTRTLVSRTWAGLIARILIPLALIFPILSGWLRMTGESLGYFDPKLGVTIFALINIAVWSSALWTSAYYLHQVEQKNRYLIEFLDKNAKTDLLTGIWNRRFLEERLEAGAATFERHKRVFSCIITDIDFFKKINDTFGHHTGDIVIKRIAQILTETARKEDIVCRYGGEEFVVLLPDTGLESATHVAERMRAVIEKTKIESGPHSLLVTASFGVAEARKNFTSVIECADANLYAAKQAGRNRVVSECEPEKSVA